MGEGACDGGGEHLPEDREESDQAGEEADIPAGELSEILRSGCVGRRVCAPAGAEQSGGELVCAGFGGGDWPGGA